MQRPKYLILICIFFYDIRHVQSKTGIFWDWFAVEKKEHSGQPQNNVFFPVHGCLKYFIPGQPEKVLFYAMFTV